jgi:hypothetical protein
MSNSDNLVNGYGQVCNLPHGLGRVTRGVGRHDGQAVAVGQRHRLGLVRQMVLPASTAGKGDAPVC